MKPIRTRTDQTSIIKNSRTWSRVFLCDGRVPGRGHAGLGKGERVEKKTRGFLMRIFDMEGNLHDAPAILYPVNILCGNFRTAWILICSSGKS